VGPNGHRFGYLRDKSRQSAINCSAIFLFRNARPLYVAGVAQQQKFHCDVCASFATAFRNWRLKHHIPLKRIASDLGLAVGEKP
jgi:hypothetical protein